MLPELLPLDFQERRSPILLEEKMEIVRFYVFFLRLAIALAMIWQLKSCTLELMGKAAAKHEMMSYSRFTKALTGR